MAKHHVTDTRPTCDWCGEAKPVRNTVSDYGMWLGVSPDWVCEDCYAEQPEPDTGRPDWDQLR